MRSGVVHRTRGPLGAAVPAGAELGLGALAAGGALPGITLLGALEKPIDELFRLLVLKVLGNPEFRPALGGRQLAGTAQEVLVLGDTLDVMTFQQLA